MITRKHQIIQSPKNLSQQTYMNGFDLYIESIRLDYKGYFQIQWRRGKKMIQTLKHESDGKLTFVKETLTLNITLTFRNSRTIEKNTVLSIIGANGQQIDEITLPVHRWTPEYSSLEIPLPKGGVLKTKARRRQLMMLKMPTSAVMSSPYSYSQGQNFSIINSDDEQYSQFIEEEINVRMMMSETKNNRITVDSQRDQSTKLRKQLQDTLYVNNKLKNDRSVLLSRNLQLQSQVTYLKTQIRQQFLRIQKYYQNKLQIRQSIYQDQINTIVTVFNSNSEYNVQILKHTVQGNHNLEQEIKKLKKQMEDNGREFVGYEEKMLEIQSQKELLRGSIKEYEERMENEKGVLGRKIVELEGQIQGLVREGAEINLTMLKYKSRIEELQRDKLDRETQKLSLETELQFAKKQIHQLTIRIEQLEGQLDESKNQLDFTEQTYKKQKQSSQNNEEALRTHIKKLQSIITQFELQKTLIKQDQTAKYQTYVKENQNFRKQIMRLRGQLSESNEQVKNLRKMLQEQKEVSKKAELNLQRYTEQSKVQIEMKVKQRQLEHSKSMMENSMVITQKIGEIEKLAIELRETKQELQKLNQQIKNLNLQNQNLKDQLQFINENGIKIEQHEQLQNRVVQLEGKLAEYEMQYNNIQFPSFEKEMAHHQSGEKKEKTNRQDKKSLTNSNPKMNTDFENISFEAGHSQNITFNQRMKTMEQQLKGSRIKIEQLVNQNKQLRQSYSLILVEVEELKNRQRQILKELQIAKATEVKVVEYCQSDEEANHRHEQAEEELHETRQIERLSKVKKTTSLQESILKRSLKVKRENKVPEHNIAHQQQNERVSFQTIQKQQTRPKHDKSEPEQQKIATFRTISGKNQQIVQQQNPKKSKKGSRPIQKSSILSKMSQVRVDIQESNREAVSSKSAHSNQQLKESFVSGTTLYKFQRVSHRQKIKRLQQEVSDLQKYTEQSKQRQLEMISQIQKANKKVEEFENQLRQIEEDRQSLKASLHFELQKKNVLKQNRSSQTNEKQRSHRAVQANIVLEDKEKVGLQQELSKSVKMFGEIQKELKIKIDEYEVRQRNLVGRLEDGDRKFEDVAKKLQQKNQQTDRLKKQLKLLEKTLQQKETQSKNNLHTLRLQKTQTDFLLQKHDQQNKRLRQRIEQLQEKLKKNDVVDAYKQAQYELQNLNKRILDLNRQIYQMKLEKDTVDDQLKLLRKKNQQTVKKSTQLQYTIQNLEKAIEQSKRKESRHRRQIQDRQDTIQKQRDQAKRLSDEISMLKSLNNEQMFERKKYMDEITALQNAAERKEYELLNLKKQIERLRYRLQEKEEQRSEHKLSLRRQIQHLQTELSLKNKQNFELEATIKQLTNKLDFLTTQNKRTMHQKSGLYSQKLKAYIEEIADIKKLLDDNNIENNSLKYQIKEYEEEVMVLKSQNGKMEERINEEVNGNRELMGLLQGEHGQSEKYKERVQELEQEIFNIRNALKNVKNQQQQQRKDSQNKKQSLENLTKQNQLLLQQLNKNKIKISEYETQLQINRNYNDKLSENDKQLRNASKQLKETKRIYEQYRTKYQHTPGELESALRLQENKLKQKYEQIIHKLQEQYSNNLANSKKHLQSEILQLLAEISQTRTDSQKKSQIISQLQFKITKLQVLPLKVAEYEKLYNEKLEEGKKYKGIEQGSREMRDKVERLEETVVRVNNVREQIEQELGEFKNRAKSMQLALDEAVANGKNLERENARISKELAQLQQQQSALKQQIQNLLTLNKSQQQQKNSILQKSEQNRKEYNNKISKLEAKMQQMSSTVQEHEQALSSHYEKNLQEIKMELEKMYYQMQMKDKVLAESEDIITRLEGEVDLMRREIQKNKEKQASDAQIFELEFTKLKNKLTQKQKQYKNNVSQLQMQVEQMSKQLTNLKLKNMSQSNIPGRDQNIASSTANLNLMRLQDKLKQKDTKLQEMKQNIYVLEQTIVKLKKKETILAQYADRYAKMQKENGDYVLEIKRLEEELRKLGLKESNASAALKAELNGLKSANQRLKLALEEKELELQSARYELQTLRELYSQLQKQLDKRQINLKQKVESQSNFNQQIQKKIDQIAILQQNLQNLSRRDKNLTQQLTKKTQVIETLEIRVTNYQKMQSKLKSTTKLNNQGQHYKNQIKRLSQENQSLQKLNKKLRDQIQLLEKDNYETKTKLSLNQTSIDSLNMSLEEMSSKCRDLEQSYKKFQDMNEACYKIFHVGLDEAIFHGYISQKMDQRDIQINNLIEQVEQLKFLNERKLLDYDQLKRQNYQLQLRLEDAQFAQDQVQELRSICDKLQQEKKDAIFRQEVLKVQMESILSNSSSQTKDRLDKIKIEEMMRRITNNNGNPGRVSFA